MSVLPSPQILFVDLDDTLLDSKKKVSPALRDILQRFLDAGFYFVISTGRALISAIKVIEYLNIDGANIYISAYNGAVIYNYKTSETLYSDGISLDCVKEIFEIAARENIYCHTYSNEALVSPKNGEELALYIGILNMPYTVTNDVYGFLLEQKKDEAKIVPKIVAIRLNSRELLESFGKIIKPVLDRYHATCMTSSDSVLEILSINSNKGTALVKVCELLNIPVSASVACGDEANDVSMLKAAGIGVAMLNGTDEAKGAADMVSRYDADHDGVGRVMMDLFGI